MDQPSEAPVTDSAQQAVAAVVVLAAGGGTRMKSGTSKLLHRVGGHSLLSYALQAASALEPEHLVVVVGHLREQVLAHLHDIAPHVNTAVQDQQRGTGHAVQCGLADLGQLTGEIVVTYGDVPMLEGQTLIDLVSSHRQQHNQVTVLTALVEDPTGYGRIVRDGDAVLAIVEHRDADSEQITIREINSGIYVFDAATLAHGLANLTDDNDQGELYLTDVISIARDRGERVGAYVTDDVWQTEGVNDRVQLAAMQGEMNRRILHKWMRNGVTIVDPASTWVENGVDLGRDVTLLPGTHLEGATSVADNVTIGPDTTLVDCEVGEGASVVRSHCVLAMIGAKSSVGPFAVLRPGTETADAVKLGSFIETKAARFGAGSHADFFAYVGDAEVPAGASVPPFQSTSGSDAAHGA